MCGYSFCILCLRAYHGVDECKFKSVDKKRIIEEWNAADENGRVQMAKRFGGLKNLEKNDGCNKMQCTKCDAMFCWLCERILDKNNPYAHFNEEGRGNCVNRLFEGIAASDSDDDDFVEWANVIGVVAEIILYCCPCTCSRWRFLSSKNMKGYKVPDSREGDAAMAQFKEQLLAQKRKEEYESFLRQQMDFEEARRQREKLSG
ncbi:hypothetical protein TELCIR_14189 [Teladorsagia circumcincta]|uniref:RING-type domain-containing protein n=1 Tax=Teladorsagia circumcincta TaxID=45464 RepID=A0A2G9U1N9_TELCI|nr:hypothetical protein TELCIR_14189 [Teladorsagia circumcincta]